MCDGALHFDEHNSNFEFSQASNTMCTHALTKRTRQSNWDNGTSIQQQKQQELGGCSLCAVVPYHRDIFCSNKIPGNLLSTACTCSEQFLKYADIVIAHWISIFGYSFLLPMLMLMLISTHLFFLLARRTTQNHHFRFYRTATKQHKKHMNCLMRIQFFLLLLSSHMTAAYMAMSSKWNKCLQFLYSVPLLYVYSSVAVVAVVVFIENVMFIATIIYTYTQFKTMHHMQYAYAQTWRIIIISSNFFFQRTPSSFVWPDSYWIVKLCFVV